MCNVRRFSEKSKGFTLLELLIVMFLMALVLALGTGFFVNTLPGARLNATAREVSSMMRQTKALAQNRGEAVTLVFDLDGKQYGLETFAMKKIPPEVSMRIDDPNEGEIQHGRYSMVFRAAGGAEGGTIVLWSRKKAVYIQTDPVMGSVYVRR